MLLKCMKRYSVIFLKRELHIKSPSMDYMFHVSLLAKKIPKSLVFQLEMFRELDTLFLYICISVCVRCMCVSVFMCMLACVYKCVSVSTCVEAEG